MLRRCFRIVEAASVHASFSGRRSLSTCNTLIIGGGPIGSSTAYHLASARGSGDGIVVVEKDPTYQRASATLSAGGIRQQYSLRENVQMSLYGRDFLRNAGALLRVASDEGDDSTVDVQFREHGYLFLATTDEGRQQLLHNHKVQCNAGCTDIKLLDPVQLKATFPWLNCDDIVLGSYGTKGEGWFDPWSLIHGLKTKSMDLGVTYIHGSPVQSQRDPESGNVLSVDVERYVGKQQACGIETYHVQNIVNAAGAYSENLMILLAGPDKPLQYHLPVKPRKRSVFFFHCNAPHDKPELAPLTVDPSMVYFRSEGSGENGNFLCGVSPQAELDDDCYDSTALDQADHHLFEDIVWPNLYARVPAFGEIKVKSSWAGLYEYNTIDQNAIIDFHPEMPNVLMLNGFSGHGLQMSPATGRAAAELLDHNGHFQTLDLKIFCFDRCMGLADPVLEMGIV